MPARYYLDTVRIVFPTHLLPRGLWDVGGERVKPSAIRDTAPITIKGKLDDISGEGQTRATHTLCTSVAARPRQTQTVTALADHCNHRGPRVADQISPP